MWTTWLSAGVSRSDLCSFSVLLSTLAIYVRHTALCTLQTPNDSHSFPCYSVYENLTIVSFQTYLSTSNHLKMDNELHDLNVIHEAEDIGEAHDSTSLLDPSGGEPPSTRNNSIASEAYKASISSRRSFDHHSEDDEYVLMSFESMC